MMIVEMVLAIIIHFSQYFDIMPSKHNNKKNDGNINLSFCFFSLQTFQQKREIMNFFFLKRRDFKLLIH